MVTSNKPDKVKPPVYHNLELSRGWRILRQHVALTADLSNRTLSGTATLTFCVLNFKCCKLALNLRRCAVTSVRVNSQPVAFDILSPLDDEPLLRAVSSSRSRHRVKDVEHATQMREAESRRCGELLISVPTQISADYLEELARLTEAAKPDGKPEEIQVVSPETHITVPPPVPVYELPILNIQIDYKVLDPNQGAFFYGNMGDESKVRDPVYMLIDSRFGMARFWMPCVDSDSWCDRYLFDLDIAVDPKFLVVASGELVQTTIEPSQHSHVSSKVYKYHSHAPAHASEIVVAIGAFIAIPDPVLNDTITHFCLPGHVHELVHTGPPLLARALSYCRDFFGSCPPTSSFKQLFLGSTGLRPDASIVGAGGIVIHSGDLLHTERCIDEAVAAREAVMNAVVISYFGRFLRPRFSEDGWLICGLASHVTARGLEAILGSNWYKYRVHDLMELLRTESSCDLSSTKIDGASEATLEAVRRRSHVILYMIERRIGRDVMERALRDIVAEGRRAIVTLVKNSDLAARKPVYADVQCETTMIAPCLPAHRELTDLRGVGYSHNVPSGAVSSGFDEAVQGVAVGPFVKRLRAICGTDVRTMVRLWASSSGIPRMHVGYQYNPRKHTIEFVVKQDVPSKATVKAKRPSLLFHGSISIRVMEAEGTYDHNLDIADPIYAIEVPCHSRRSKVVKGSGGDEINTNVVTQASPLSWIRFDPENEWCKEVRFTQHESSWASLLEGERDVIGQAEACHGLRGFTTEQSAKSLLAVLKDGQFYWRVRAEAASVLASSAEGLELLIGYFRSCYTDGDGSEDGHLRPNNFSNYASYYVKRAMLRALAGARVKGTCTSGRPGGSVPVSASRFLCFVLAGHDNAGNDFDDDHYVLELLGAVTDVAVACIGDEFHTSAGDGGSPTTDSIVRQLERFKSIERMIQRRTPLVASAIVKGLCRVERAKMIHEDRRRGSVSSSLRRGVYAANQSLFRSLFDVTRRACSFDARITAFSCLLDAYGGSLEVLKWVLAFVDRTSNADDVISLRHKLVKEGEGSEETKLEGVKYDYSESPLFRCRVLDALCSAALSKEWYNGTSPLLSALRSNSANAIEICIRLLRLVVADGDLRVSGCALRVVKAAWGKGVPSCLLLQKEYYALRNGFGSADRPATEIVAMESHRGDMELGKVDVVGFASPKCTKAGKAKGIKNGKTGKSSKKASASVVIEASGDLPPKPPKSGGGRAGSVPALGTGTFVLDVPVLSTEPRARSRVPASERVGRSLRAPSPPKGRVSPGVGMGSGVAPVVRIPKSVPLGGNRRSSEDEDGRNYLPVLSSSARVGGTDRVSGTDGADRRKDKGKSSSDRHDMDKLYGGKVDDAALYSEPVTQEDEVVAVDVDDERQLSGARDREMKRERERRERERFGGREDRGTGKTHHRVSIPKSVAVGGNSGSGRASSNGLGRSLLRSVPANRRISDVRFAWHPLDDEDAEYFLQAVQSQEERQRSGGHDRHDRGSTQEKSGSMKHGKIGSRKRDAGIEGVDGSDGGIVFLDSNGTRVGKVGEMVDEEEDEEEEDGDGGIAIAGKVENGEIGDESERKKKKKKKKKKRKRDHEGGGGEDDEHRKKKKKKKKKKRESDYGEFESSRLDAANGDESKKIGKIQIKLPSRSATANQ